MNVKDLKVGQDVLIAMPCGQKSEWTTQHQCVVSAGRKYIKVASKYDAMRNVPVKYMLTYEFCCRNNNDPYLVERGFEEMPYSGMFWLLFASKKSYEDWKKAQEVCNGRILL